MEDNKEDFNYSKLQKLKPTNSPTTQTVKLTFPDGKEYELPILNPTMGHPMIDIQSLFAKTGHFTYDPGFTCTGSCSSQLTFIDGEEGKLLHRGYKIEDLSANCSYIEVCYLLLYGRLPTKTQLSKFEEQIVSEMVIHDKLIDFFKSFKAGSHPMAIMVGVVGALSAFDKVTNSYDMSEEHREATCIKLIAKIPMIAAIAFRTSLGLPVVYPHTKYSYVENFLRMMFKDPMSDWVPNPIITKALDKILLLHADHEQNASTSTVRITATSNANPYACIAAGIASLWGPMHGGANEACVHMLDQIGDLSRIPEFIAKAKDKTSTFRLMGFGHRVYKNFDPRSKVMKEVAIEILKQSNRPDKTLKLAMELEKAALADDYFISRKLYPNVDFYTGTVYRAIGIPLDMFTVMFAVARTSGWVCQWREMMLENQRKIGRPRQLYVGEVEKPFVKIEDRSESEEVDFPAIPKLQAFIKLPIL